MVAVGLASYSAYLWHQPILAMMRTEGGEIGDYRRLALFLLLTAMASVLSYFLVEMPFRRKLIPVRVQQMVFLALSIGLVTFGIAGNRSLGFESWKLAQVAPDRRQMYIDRDEAVTARNAERDRIVAIQGEVGEARNVVLGDSMGSDLLLALDSAGAEARLVPIDGNCLRDLVAGKRACGIELDDILGQLHEGQTVWLAWVYVRERTEDEIGEIYRRLTAAGIETRVLGGFMFQDISNRSFRFMRGNRPMMDINREYFSRLDPRNERNDKMRAMVGEEAYVDKMAYFCSAEATSCAMYLAPDEPLFIDQLHMTKAGIAYLGRKLRANEPALAHLSE
jgi:hypothetical protein